MAGETIAKTKRKKDWNEDTWRGSSDDDVGF